MKATVFLTVIVYLQSSVPPKRYFKDITFSLSPFSIAYIESGVNFSIESKFQQEMIWALLVIVFTKNELSCIKIRLRVRFLSNSSKPVLRAIRTHIDT